MQAEADSGDPVERHNLSFLTEMLNLNNAQDRFQIYLEELQPAISN
jgi:hypothetical protein